MPHASHPSLPSSASVSPLALNRRLRRWLAQEWPWVRTQVQTSAARCDADRYRKHFDAFRHACLLLFHGFAGTTSLRQSYAAFAVCSDLVALSGLAPQTPAGDRLGVSYSQVAASNTSRPAAFLGGLVAPLLERVRQALPRSVEAVLAQTVALDSTFLRVSLGLAPWLPHSTRADIPGVRPRVLYRAALDLPESVLLTSTRLNDCQGLDQLILDDPARLAALAGQTLIVDLGYYSHARFARLRAAGVHWVTRRQAQATLRVEADLPLQQPLPGSRDPRLTLIADQRVTVGSATNRAGAVLPGLRLVTAQVAPRPAAARRGATVQTYQVLTDRWDLAADEVVLLYLWRWQIELFFRWLKSHVHLTRLLGCSRNAVELSVWLALVVHLLACLAATTLALGRRSPILLRQLGWVLAHLGLDDVPTALPACQLPLFPSDLFAHAPPKVL